jgi:hypothetical protein
LNSKLTRQELADTEKIAALIAYVDKIDAVIVNKISDEWATYQPFLISLLIGDSMDMVPEVLEECMKSYILIWEYFKERNGLHQKAINQQQHTRLLERNLRMIQYMGEEPTERAAQIVVQSDLEHLAAKALFVGVRMRFEQSPVMLALDPNLRNQYLVCMKTLIECFEENEK